MTYAVGSLIAARGRDWVVLPDSTDDLLLVRPLGGTEDEATGIFLPLEAVAPAVFPPPSAEDIGEHHSARLLRDALRLGFRSTAGPFRSFGNLAVDPRPYQLVPLLMALRLDPVRLLIADDVGIGKTIEAGLVLRELLDRGEMQRFAVLCPPHLVEQWQNELREKFHLETEAVTSATAARLDRAHGLGQSLFEVFPHTVVSIDFIKSDRHRADFLRKAPELVIVDEAHTCAWSGEEKASARQQRHLLLVDLARDSQRHLLLMTATPHSGHESAFRSLLTLLDPAFAELPEDLSGERNAKHRRLLARHLVQRRRSDLAVFAGATPFPERDRESPDVAYSLSRPYRDFLDRILTFCRESVLDEGTQRTFRQRVRWWSALALLRSVSSSPAAAVATLKRRSINLDASSETEADDLGRRRLLDLMDADTLEGEDQTPGADFVDTDDPQASVRRRLRTLAAEAEQLGGARDAKLQCLIGELRQLLHANRTPIIFCRFIDTAEYLATHLREAFSRASIAAVTGLLPAAEREHRVRALTTDCDAGHRAILVCTDCLSEGINLQEHFDAVIHYDLPWNPTRLEQREGRVDRFGQPQPSIAIRTLYGSDNPIDGIILDVLLRKHQIIRNSLGISVPVPVDHEQIISAIFEGILLREQSGTPSNLLLPGLEEYLGPQKRELHARWELSVEREKRSRTVFAQQTLKPEEILPELQATQRATGDADLVRDFLVRIATLAGGQAQPRTTAWHFDFTSAPAALRDALPDPPGTSFEVTFGPIESGRALCLQRTHPLVASLAQYTLDAALDPVADGPARRAGAIRTRVVATRTTLLLLRGRFHLHESRRGTLAPLLVEDFLTLAFEGAPESPRWLTTTEAEALFEAQPAGNIAKAQQTEFVGFVLDALPSFRPVFERAAAERAGSIASAHQRVRQAAQASRGILTVEPQLPLDLLGVYLFLPEVRPHA